MATEETAASLIRAYPEVPSTAKRCLRLLSFLWKILSSIWGHFVQSNHTLLRNTFLERLRASLPPHKLLQFKESRSQPVVVNTQEHTRRNWKACLHPYVQISTLFSIEEQEGLLKWDCSLFWPQQRRARSMDWPPPWCFTYWRILARCHCYPWSCQIRGVEWP